MSQLVSVLQHVAIAIALQAVVGLTTGDWLAGGCLGAGIFVGREHAQAEYRYIQANGGLRYKTPLPPEIGALTCFDRDSIWDALAPTIAVFLVCFLVG